MHSGTSARGHDGLFRRRVCCVPLVSAERDAVMSFQEAVLRKARESLETKQRFFEANAMQISDLSRKMAERFQKGNRLYVMGNGGSACDALHLAVEFTHPVVEKRRPLPAS